MNNRYEVKDLIKNVSSDDFIDIFVTNIFITNYLNQ